MDLDAQAAGAWVGRWWIEAALGLVALVGVATGIRNGDPVRVLVAAALAAAVVDRIRLRMDNRSLALAVRAVRDEGVSTARREAGIAVEREERGEGGGTRAEADGGSGSESEADSGSETEADSGSESESGEQSGSEGTDGGEGEGESGAGRPDVEDVIRSATDDERG